MSTPGFYLVWSQSTVTLVGQVSGSFVQEEAIQGISFPGSTTTPLSINLASCARELNTFDNLINVKLYLTGDSDQIKIIQSDWPAIGGGLQISFDGGRTYNTFTTTYGYQATPSTWVLLPAEAIGLNGNAGTLSPFDSANLLLRYIIPTSAVDYDIFQIALTADFDVA
jgi:hypothetical protein